MAVGERIKRARNFRGMTQKAFGIALGFDPKSADVRIAQYEANKRKPKEDLLKRMAQILNVNFRSLYEPISYTAENVMFTLFEMDERYPISLHNIIDDSDPYYPTPRVAVNFNYKLLDDFMNEWMKKKQELNDGLITKEEYFEWKVNWPDTVED